MWSPCEFTLLKGKKTSGKRCFTATAIPVYFASLTLIQRVCKLPFIRISLVTKINSAFDFSDAFILEHPVYFDYQDFSDFASDLHSKVLMQKSCEKCCD